MVALSTAEAELIAMVDALQAGRSVRSFIELIHPGTDMMMFGDNRAALILAGGQGGGWRTRHLRIRSSAIADALKRGELKMQHMAGTRLLADALTKLLHAVPLQRFCVGMGMIAPQVQSPSIRGLNVPTISSASVRERVSQCLGLLISCLTFLPGVGASLSADEDRPSSSMDWTLILLLVSVVALWEVFRSLGSRCIRWACSHQDDLKVKVLSDQAVLPARASTGAAGFDISTAEPFSLEPGERKLVSTGLQMEFPFGTYGRLASRSGLASNLGLDVGAGVIDSDFRGEVKVLIFNHGHQSVCFKAGDRVAQLIVEKVAVSNVSPVQTLSSTARGCDGFGSSGTSSMLPSTSTATASSAPTSDLRLRSLRTSTSSCSATNQDTSSAQPSDHTLSEFLTAPEPLFLHRGSWFGEYGQSMESLINERPESFRRDLLLQGWNFSPPTSKTDSKHDVFIDGTAATIFTHGKSRQKLFDVRAETEQYRLVRVSLIWLSEGRPQVIVDRRNGYHSELLRSKWKGFTILFRRA